MKLKYLPLLMFLALGLIWLLKSDSKSEVGEGITEQDTPSVVFRNVPSSAPASSDEPRWMKWPRMREVSDPKYGVVLGDLESHMPKDHVYRDANKMTWAHETTHGINANIRNRTFDHDAVNGFYVLQDRAILLKEPKTTIRDVALTIPEVLRGPSYKLYLVEQAVAWNDRPLYLIDEWISYTNGSEVGKELNVYGWHYELLQAHNFNIYCTYLAMVIQRDLSDYQETEFKKFLKWNTERVFRITLPSDKTVIDKGMPDVKVAAVSNTHICPHQKLEVGGEFDMKIVDEYLEVIRKSPQADKFRKFAKSYFGNDWCKKVYGF
jgi:hypothetical protein